MTKELLPGLLAVTVSDQASLIFIADTDFGYMMLVHKIPNGASWQKQLPPGTWSILGIGTADKITEDEWKGVVEAHTVKYTDGTESTGWKDYEYDENEPIPELHDAAFLPFTLAGESGLSLLKLHGLNPETTVLLTSKTNT